VFAIISIVTTTFAAFASIIFLWKRNTLKVYKALFGLSFLLNVALGYGFIHYAVLYSYSSPAYKNMKQSFEDLAAVFPKNTSRKDIETVWSKPVEVYPPRPDKNTRNIGLKTGEVIFYFNEIEGIETGGIKAIRSSYKPWLEDYD
jgi:hypothetical protein